MLYQIHSLKIGLLYRSLFNLILYAFMEVFSGDRMLKKNLLQYYTVIELIYFEKFTMWRVLFKCRGFLEVEWWKNNLYFD